MKMISRLMIAGIVIGPNTILMIFAAVTVIGVLVGMFFAFRPHPPATDPALVEVLKKLSEQRS